MLNYRLRNAGKKALEVYIYDAIGDFWGEGISAKRFADDIRAAGQVDLITVRINSPGGLMFDGIAMYNVLDRHPARVEVDVDGMALSAASIVAMAGDEIRIAANAMMMIHNPQSIALGDADAMRHEAEVLDQAKVGLVNTYAARSAGDAKEISDMMDAETWFTAQEAVDAGLADVVTGELAIAACFDPTRYRNVPARLKALANRRSPTPALDLYTARIAAQARRLNELRRQSAA